MLYIDFCLFKKIHMAPKELVVFEICLNNNDKKLLKLNGDDNNLTFFKYRLCDLSHFLDTCYL